MIFESIRAPTEPAASHMAGAVLELSPDPGGSSTAKAPGATITERARPDGRPTPDLRLNLTGIFWTEVAKIHSRTKPTNQVLHWDTLDQFPAEGEPIRCRRASNGSPSSTGPYMEIMSAIKSVSDTEDAKQTVLDIIRSEQAHLRNCIEQMHSTNAALQWIAMNPSNGHAQLAQLVDVNRWLRCERSQILINVEKLKSDALQPVSELAETPTYQESDAGASDCSHPCSTPSILRYDVVKINRVNRNSRRVIEIDVRQHSLAIVRPESVRMSSSSGSVHSELSHSAARLSVFGSQRELFSCRDDPENILLSNTMITDVRLSSPPAFSRRSSLTPARSEIHIEYLTSSMRKSKVFRGFVATVAERDQLFAHICLHVLQKPSLLIPSSPSTSSIPTPTTAPIGTIRASGSYRSRGPVRRAFSATIDTRTLPRSLASGSHAAFSEETAPILPVQRIAERAHSNWALDKLAQKWVIGKRINLKSKVHTELIPFNELTRETQQLKVESVRRIIHSICDFGYTIESSDSVPGDEDTLELSDKKHLLSILAVTLHETWIDITVNSGWRFGGQFDEVTKRHPNLTPFSCLDAFDISEYTNQAQFNIDAISELGMVIQYSHRHARANSRVQSM